MRLKWYFLYGIYCELVLYLRHSTKQSGQPYIVKRVVGRYQIQRERESKKKFATKRASKFIIITLKIS